MNHILNKIKKQIEELSLDLSGKFVLTEAATGPYVVTPIIASISGAKVFSFAKDSGYGTASEVFEIYKKMFADLNLNPDIEFIDKIDNEIISKADIITNSGHLRPLNAGILKRTKEGCVIPLMYEAWELRDSDLDVKFCKENNIKVGATNERHKSVDVFSYLGDMAVKQILDSGRCLYENSFVLICNNDFGPYIAETILKMCKNLGVIDLSKNKKSYDNKIDWLSDFPEINIPDKYKDAEAIIFTAYPFDKNWIVDEKSQIPAEKLIREFNDPFIIRYAGDMDTHESDIAGLKYYPSHVRSGHMGILPSDIGYDPVIRLQAGGLKAGELMLKGEVKFKDEILVELI